VTRQRYRRKSLEPGQWRPALLGQSVWLTEQEYVAAKEELFAVLERYRRHRDLLDPSQAPAGSREARMFIAVSVAPPGTPAKDS